MYKDRTMYQMCDVIKTRNNSYEEFFEFTIENDGMYFEAGASYGQVGLNHEEGKNLLLLTDSNDVLFIDVCEVDELFDRMFEIEPEEELEEDPEDLELFELTDDMLEDMREENEDE